MTLGITIREWWQWLYAQFCTFVYFDRVSLVGDERPVTGPVLFVGTHRNGILDAFVYSNALGRMTFVLAKRLHKSFLGRVLFGGIGVVRESDGGDRITNAKAILEARDYLRAGSRIFVFPEGTSALGPRLLDIRPGAAKITLETLKVRPDLKVVPVAVAYERAWGFRSRVEIKLGRPVTLDDLVDLEEDDRFDVLHQRISDGLHTLASEFETESAQEAAEAAANLQRLAGLSNHSDAVKANANRQEEHQGRALAKAWSALLEAGNTAHAARYNRVPMICEGSLLIPLLRLLTFGPFVLFMLMINAPILLSARFGARKLAKDTNVISLMRMMIGLPLMFLWGAATLTCLAFLGVPSLWIWSVSVSLVGLGAYDTVKRAGTLVWNHGLRRDLRPVYRAFVDAAGAAPVAV
jgi:1-acyl-sn-glycerol-3-phosphate acyltransferase